MEKKMSIPPFTKQNSKAVFANMVFSSDVTENYIKYLHNCIIKMTFAKIVKSDNKANYFK